MRKEDVLQLPSMPAAGPSYPAGPYRFIDREFLVITYETDPELIRAQLPEPLEPIEQPLVHYEWIKMPDSSGFGSYTESGMVIPARLRGEEVNFVAQMYLDDDPPIAAGREIWGFPKKYAHPTLEIVKDTCPSAPSTRRSSPAIRGAAGSTGCGRSGIASPSARSGASRRMAMRSARPATSPAPG
jgi:acetoacetate decarboxylase